MTSATPKPRAGEHISTPARAVIVLESLAARRGKSFHQNRKSSDAEEALFELREWLFKVGERKEAINELQAERDLLRARERELVEALEKIAGDLELRTQWTGEVNQSLTYARTALAKHGR